MASFNNAICKKVEIERGGRVFIKTEIIGESFNPSNYSHNPVVDYKDIDPGHFVIKEELDESDTGFIAQIKVEESLSYPVIESSKQCDIIVRSRDTGSENNLIHNDFTEIDEGTSHSAADTDEGTSHSAADMDEGTSHSAAGMDEVTSHSTAETDQGTSHSANETDQCTSNSAPDKTPKGLILNDLLTLSNQQEPQESFSKDIVENKSSLPSMKSKGCNPEVEVLNGTQMKHHVEECGENSSDVADKEIISSDINIDLRKRVEALIPKNLRFPIGDYKCYCCCKQFKLLSDWEDHIVEYFQTAGCFPMKMEMPSNSNIVIGSRHF